MLVPPWRTSQPANSRQSRSYKAWQAQHAKKMLCRQQPSADKWSLVQLGPLGNNGEVPLTCRSRLSTMAGSRPSTLRR
jgi:hypothetical protein